MEVHGVGGVVRVRVRVMVHVFAAEASQSTHGRTAATMETTNTGHAHGVGLL